jgi:hypothetical protein
MGTELATIEPIQPPDVRRPAKLAKLPQWVALRCDILKKEIQRDRTGRFREIPVLPQEMMLGADEKKLIEQHVRALDDFVSMTPENDERHGEITLVTVTKMTLVLPSRESGDLAGEAKGEAYMAALSDVPCWAVQEAMRKWHRAEYGQKYDYRWQPAPATLREISLIETYRVKGLRRQLHNLAVAEPLIEYSEAHCAAMKTKVSEYLKTRQS